MNFPSEVLEVTEPGEAMKDWPLGVQDRQALKERGIHSQATIRSNAFVGAGVVVLDRQANATLVRSMVDQVSEVDQRYLLGVASKESKSAFNK